ncbi:MAG: 5'/3'-nucleotidase SurE [Planctomycetota bacterium]|nr:5'/3'-nucleotidase SurE [Planctomycetota bacterium]
MLLLINDDGIHAPGLRHLYRALRKETGMPVLAVAPSVQHSGQSHAITLDRGLTATPILEDDFFGFSVDGTPTDCVKLALKVLLPKEPRLVISGINDGPNVGRSLFYSGTVGAAIEAAIEGHPAIAISRDHGEGDDMAQAARYAAGIAKACLGRRELRGVVLNINIPAKLGDLETRPRLAHHGHSGFEETYRARRDQNGRLTWRLSGTRVERSNEGVTDAHLLRSGLPTLTVLHPDFNADGDHLPARLLARITAQPDAD